MVRHRCRCALLGAVAGLVGCANDATVGGPRADAALVSPAGRRAVATAAGSYTLISKIPVLRPFDIAVNPRTDRIYVLSHDFANPDPEQSGRLAVIDGQTSQVVASLGVGRLPTSVQVDPEINRVYVARYDGSMLMIDGATLAVILEVPAGDNLRFISLNPLTKRIYTVLDAVNLLGVFNSVDGTSLGSIPVPVRPGPLAVNPATERLYYVSGASWLDDLVVVDPSAGRVVAHLNLGFLLCVAVNPVTNRIYAGSLSFNGQAYEAGVFVVDGSTHTVAAQVPVAVYPTDIAVDEVVDRIYVMEIDAGTVAVIDGATNSVVTRLPLVPWARHLGVNPQTHRVYISDDFGSLVWVYGWEAAPVGMEAISALVRALVSGGSLNNRDATGLLSKLDAAASLAADGKPAPAQALLNAFLKQINALVASGRLTDAEAQPLRDATMQEIASLGG